MTKIEALVSITQTLMRCRGSEPDTLAFVSGYVADCNRLVGADRHEVNAAVVELARRYCIGVPV